MSFASVSTVAVSLLVLGMFLLIFLNTNNLAKYLESQVQITVYMQDNANDKDLEAMSGKLKALPGVVSVKQVKKAEALNRFKERLGEQENLLSALGTENPFPNSFEVQVDVPERQDSGRSGSGGREIRESENTQPAGHMKQFATR